jgi:acyl-CoA thioester hydrolase
MKTAMTEPIHRTTYRVLYGDTDAGGVVYYGNYLRYFELGRTEYMRELVQVSYREIEEQGLILPVIECYARYKASAHYDDLLLIETSLSELKNVSCRFSYRIHRQEDNGTKTLLVKGSTINASVDRNNKLTRLPADLMERLKKILSLSSK